MTHDSDPEWKARFSARPSEGATPPCPKPETLSAWAAGPLPEDAVSHLAACASCREELVALRRDLAERGKTEAARTGLRLRLHAFVPRRSAKYIPISIAAAVLLGIFGLILVLFPSPRPQDPPRVVVQPPRPAVSPVEPPKPTPVPERPAPPPLPVEKLPTPEQPKLAVSPVEPPKPPEPTVVSKPEPAAPPPPSSAPSGAREGKPKPVDPPAPTRVKLRGTLIAIAGTCAAQAEGDVAAQNVRPAQSRDFTGALRLKADAGPVKARIGSNVYFLPRGAELSVSLDDAGTNVRLAKGEAFFDVTPGKEPFSVETSAARVVVRGTRFLVADAEVVVQRGNVDVTAGDRTVAVASGEKSPTPALAVQKAELAKRLAWVRALEESILIEAEQLALQQGMAVAADPTASGGRAIGTKGPPVAGQEPAAEIRAKRKQPAPYAVWIRLHWGHNVPCRLTVQIHEAPRWTASHVAFSTSWQWVRVGAFDLPDDPFRLRIADPAGGARIDQILITSDLDLVPEERK